MISKSGDDLIAPFLFADLIVSYFLIIPFFKICIQSTGLSINPFYIPFEKLIPVLCFLLICQ